MNLEWDGGEQDRGIHNNIWFHYVTNKKARDKTAVERIPWPTQGEWLSYTTCVELTLSAKMTTRSNSRRMDDSGKVYEAIFLQSICFLNYLENDSVECCHNPHWSALFPTKQEVTRLFVQQTHRPGIFWTLPVFHGLGNYLPMTWILFVQNARRWQSYQLKLIVVRRTLSVLFSQWNVVRLIIAKLARPI